jgi:hypothetical protein
MKTDGYIKAVLTIIAGALLALVAQNFVKSSNAQGNQVTKVAICTLDGAACAHVEPNWACVGQECGAMRVK